MKKIALGIALLAGMSATAQDKLEVTGKIDGLKEGEPVFFWRPFGIGKTDSCYVKDGRFVTTIDMSEGGSTYIIKIGKEADEVTTTFMYLEAGKVDFTGKGPYFKDVVVTGSPFVKDWQALTSEVLGGVKDSEKEQALVADLENAQQIGDADVVQEISAELGKLQSVKQNLAKEWVKKHPNAGVSSFLINAYLGNGMANDELLKMIDQCGPKVKNTFTIRYMIKNITGVGTIVDKVGQAAPGFELKDNNGKTVKLSDFKGQYVMLDFWASWCKPCRESNPEIAAAYNKYKDKGFTVLSVSIDESHEKWKTAIAEDKMNWVQLIGERGPSSKVAQDYSVVAVPAGMLIGPDGKLLKIGVNGKNIGEVLSKLL
ncbi:redoxin domain-containing protein [Chitinophaga lutea]